MKIEFIYCCRAFTRSITVNFISNRRGKNKTYEIDLEQALLQADHTARQYQILFGLETLPRLFKRNLENNSRSDIDQNRDNISYSRKGCDYTGKIIISIPDRSARIEHFDRNENIRKVFDHPLNDNEENLQQLLD
jgi:hypothetical protein